MQSGSECECDINPIFSNCDIFVYKKEAIFENIAASQEGTESEEHRALLPQRQECFCYKSGDFLFSKQPAAVASPINKQAQALCVEAVSNRKRRKFFVYDEKQSRTLTQANGVIVCRNDASLGENDARERNLR